MSSPAEALDQLVGSRARMYRQRALRVRERGTTDVSFLEPVGA